MLIQEFAIPATMAAHTVRFWRREQKRFDTSQARLIATRQAGHGLPDLFRVIVATDGAGHRTGLCTRVTYFKFSAHRR